MNKHFTSVMAVLACLCFSQDTLGTVRRVTPTGTSTTSGSAWTDAAAFGDLQTAISASLSGDTLWVKAGTYQPATSGSSFAMRQGVVMLGGFNGSEVTAAERNWNTNVTILRGNNATVILNIFTSGSRMTTSSVLDGFTVTGGRSSSYSGGMHNFYASPTVINCQFLRDTTTVSTHGYGGGMGNLNSSPVVSNSVFKHNYSILSGGGICNSSSSGIFTNIIVDSNTAYNQGGGIANWYPGTPRFRNLVISNNIVPTTAGGSGGGMCNLYSGAAINIVNAVFINNKVTVGRGFGGGGYWNWQGTSSLTNVTFVGNSSDYGGAVSSTNGGTINIKNTIFWNNTASLAYPDIAVTGTPLGTPGTANTTFSFTQVSTSGTGNILGTTDPFLNNAYPKGADGLWMTSDDGLQLPFCSDIVNVGNNTGITATDILDRPRVNSAKVDLGAYEKQSNVVDYEYNVKLSTSSANALPFIKTCDDGEWTFYADPTNPDSLSFGIAWGASNATAKAAATMSLVVDTANTAATTTTDGIWTMRRYWNVHLGATTLTAPVKVRFYYNPTDTVAMRASADAWNTTYGSGLYTISPIRWFKTTTGAFSPPVVTATDINSGNKKMLNPVYGYDNGVAYVQFDTVMSFSGGTAAIGGQAGAVALPVKLIRYTAQYADNGASVLNNWTVGQESAAHYNVQRSIDAQQFETMGSVAATKDHTYAYTDLLPASVKGRQLYYRLAIVDADNSISYSNMVRLSAGKASEAMLNIAPNPASSSFTIVNTDAGRNGQEAVITDLFGTVISRITIAAELSVSTQFWLPGVYILRLADAAVYRIVKQ